MEQHECDGLVTQSHPCSLWSRSWTNVGPCAQFSPLPGHNWGHIPKPSPAEAVSVPSQPSRKICSGGSGTAKQWALLGKIVLQ